MRNIIHLLILSLLFSCQSQNKKSDLQNENKKEYEKQKVVFSAYTTAENGLNYREKPNMDSKILGKYKYGSKINIIDNSNYPLFNVEDNKRGSLTGKWIGVEKDTSVVYIFDGYLFKTSPEIDNQIKIVNGKLELIYNEIRNINSNMRMIIEMHIQTSNDLADYLIVKLEENNRIVNNHKIKYLFKESYKLKRTKDTNLTFEYSTLYDECPSTSYRQTFVIKESEILKINEQYYEADEEENN